MKKTTYIIIISAVIGSVAFLAYKFTYPEVVVPAEIALENNSEIVASSTGEFINLGNGIVAEVLDFKASTSTLAKLNMATLDKTIVPPKNAVAEIFKRDEATIKKIVASIKEKPDSFDNWIELGTYRKIIEDYTGAKEAWENASILSPNNALPLSNLGNLYGYYLKDSITAEKYYLASIKAEPNSGFWYYQTFLFYKEAMNDMVKAKNIIAEGAKNNPNDTDLEAILNSL